MQCNRRAATPNVVRRSMSSRALWQSALSTEYEYCHCVVRHWFILTQTFVYM